MTNNSFDRSSGNHNHGCAHAPGHRQPSERFTIRSTMIENTINLNLNLSRTVHDHC
ncbi:hypothetical protein [Nocardia abscessus]|uniref:hypothetical protein n=1 Tax=Nocardia abscessus TaxID=120957 RepID=UPI0024560516|nr:hypothetical protein [Nocardia abscessus]